MASAGSDDEEDDRRDEDSRSSSPMAGSTYDDPALYDPTPGGSAGLYGRPGFTAARGEHKTRTRGQA